MTTIQMIQTIGTNTGTTTIIVPVTQPSSTLTTQEAATLGMKAIDAATQVTDSSASNGGVEAELNALPSGPTADEFKQLDHTVGNMMTSLVDGDSAGAAAYTKAAAELAKALAAQPNSNTIYGLSGAVAAIVAFIDQINQMQSTLANWTASAAHVNEAYTNEESKKLSDAQTGDTWVPGWANDEPKAHAGTGMDKYYCPGINQIPVETDPSKPNSDPGGFWLQRFNTNYQLLQQTYQGYVTVTQGIAQSLSDAVGDTGKATQGDYQNLGSLIQIFSATASLLRNN